MIHDNDEPVVKSHNLAHLFGGDNTYIVPTYQRDYEWQDEQVQALCEDLELFVSSDDNYYLLGQIIIAPNLDESTKSWLWSIVDGQQRLTTLFLMFIVLEEQFRKLGMAGEGIAGSPEAIAIDQVRSVLSRIDARNGNPTNRLRATPLANEPIIKLQNREELSNVQVTNAATNVQNNHALLRAWARESLNTSEDWLKFVTRVLYSVHVIEVSVNSEDQALAIFEKVNNRGMPLNSAALLKYLLFQHAKSGEFQQIHERWEVAATSMFSCKPHSIASMQYLMQAMLQPETGTYVKATDVHKRWKTIVNAPNSEFADVDSFTNKIVSSAATLAKLASASSNGLNQHFYGSRFFAVSQHLPTALQATISSDKSGVDFAKFARLIDARVTLSLFAQERANFLYPVMWKWSKALKDGDAGGSWDDYLDSLQISEHTLSNLFQEAKNNFLLLDYQQAKDKKKIRYALAVIANRIQNHAYPDETENLTEYLVTGSRAAKRYDVDHIFPQSLTRRPEFDASDGSLWWNQIGNLCLFYSKDNRAASNITPEEKSRDYAVSRLISTQLLARNEDHPSLENGLAKTSVVAAGMRARGAQRAENWNKAKANAQGLFYWSVFEEALRESLCI